MSVNDDAYFLENVVDVNKKVKNIFIGTIFVPITFIVLTIAGLWIVPHSYSLSILLYSLSITAIYILLIKKNVNPLLLMYLGVIFSSMFVFLLSMDGIILISISYSFPPFVACLYYNKRLTRTTTVVCFLLAILSYWMRSFSVDLVTHGLFTSLQWFTRYVVGLVIEYTFLFVLTTYMSARIHNTLEKLIQSMAATDDAYSKLKERTVEIEKVNAELQETNERLDETQFKIIQFVAQCLGSHDLFTGRHVIHTQKYVEVICNELVRMGYYTEELTKKNIQLFVNAAFLHDIGKIHVPEGILNKIGKFTEEEFAMMKCHPEEGKKLLEFLPQIEDGRFNEIAKEMTYCHHEKWDGTGYPRGLVGENIPLCARIMAAADVLDALISQRLYKEPMTIDETMDVFEKSKGMHFEPCIADAVINSRKLIAIIDHDFKVSEASTNAKELEWWQRYHSNANS
jgi:response regulator RpfG family c-di-GMP phosphodiesterase